MSKTLLFLYIPLFMWGCAEETHLAEEGNRVALQPGVTTAVASLADSRSIVNNVGTAADQINTVGIYVARESGMSLYPGTSATGTVFTAPTTTGQAWTSADKVYVHGIAGRLFAWSPSDLVVTGNTSGGPTIPVDIPAVQTFDGANEYACSTSDYMYGAGTNTMGSTAPISVSNTASTPAIYMQHSLAQVVFTMESAADRPAEAEYDYVWSIKCSGGTFYIATSKTMNLVDGSIDKTRSGNLTFKCDSNPKRLGATGAPTVVAYGLVIPNETATNVMITVIMGGSTADSNTRTYISTALAFSAAWQAGHRYTYHLTLGKKSVSVRNVTIKPWVEFNDESEADGGTMSPENNG